MAQPTGVFFMLALSLSVVQACELTLHPDTAETATRNFMKQIGQSGMTVVFMNVYVEKEDGGFELYQVGDNHDSDTFLPWRWVWASSGGAFILQLPLDYPVLSLGALATTTAEMEVHLQANPPGCGSNMKNWIPTIAQILIRNVTGGTGYDASGFGSGGGGVFRTARLERNVTGVRGLVGYKCCVWSKELGQWACDEDHSSGWMVTWFGPLIIVGWMYVMLITKCIAEFRQRKATLKFGKIIAGLKLYVMSEAVQASNRIPMANSPSELLSRYDSITYLDLLDISWKTQMKLANILRIGLVVMLFLCYYAYTIGSVMYYWSKVEIISALGSADEVALNVFGHIGWVFAGEAVWIRYYAMVELVLTCLVPLMILFMYVSQRTQYQTKPAALSKVHPYQSTSTGYKLPPIVTPPTQPTQPTQATSHVEFADVAEQLTHVRRTRLRRCVHSGAGRALNTVCTMVVLLYTVAIVCPYAAYVAYFLLKSALLSMTVLATWLLPAGVTLQYMLSVIAPLRAVYAYAKARLFAHIEADAAANAHLAVTHEDVTFIPRVLMTGFYHRYARRQIFNCVLRAMSAVAVLVLLFVVLYSSGSQALQNNGSSILGVNMVLLLPVLARATAAKDLEEAEKRTLDRAVREDVAQRIKARKQWIRAKELSLRHKSIKKKFGLPCEGSNNDGPALGFDGNGNENNGSACRENTAIVTE